MNKIVKKILTVASLLTLSLNAVACGGDLCVGDLTI